MEYCFAEKRAIKTGQLPVFSKTLYTNILSSIICPNLKKMHAPIDVQVLVIITISSI